MIRNATDLEMSLPTDFDPALLSHEREGDLLRALAEFPRVVGAAAELREPHRIARYLEDTASVFNKWYDTKECRMLPQGDEEGHADERGPAGAGARRPDGAVQRSGPARRLGPREDVTRCPPHTRRAGRMPTAPSRDRSGCVNPRIVNALVPQLWSSTAHKVDGDLVIGGVNIPDLVANVNTPAYVLDEADFRARARAFKDAFAPAEVYYAGKAFLCTTVARWLQEEGSASTCAPMANSPSRCARASTRSGSAITATTRPNPNSGAPSPRASGGSSWTRSTRSTG
jgi:hypothetical protein